jgi:hypothetical protein
MPITFSQLLNDTETVLAFEIPYSNYIPELIWDREWKLIPWAKMIMLSFPVLRPKLAMYKIGIPDSYHILELPEDYREIMSIEFPTRQDPPEYLIRKNHLNQGFFGTDLYYDVDFNYEAGTGYNLIVSRTLEGDDTFYVNYLTNHDVDLEDNETDLITIPDQYEDVIIMGITTLAYREFLSWVSFEPTVLETTILHLSDMCAYADAKYSKMLSDLINKTGSGDSTITPNRTVDKYDRVY